MKTQPRLNSRVDTPENQIKMTNGNHKRKIPQCLLAGIKFTFKMEMDQNHFPVKVKSALPKPGWMGVHG